MRGAIALFTTLLIFVLLSLLVAVALQSAMQMRQASVNYRYLIQENLMLADIKRLLDRQVADKLRQADNKTKAQMLQLMTQIPLQITNPIDKSEIRIQLSSYDGRVDINALVQNLDMRRYRNDLFEALGFSDVALLVQILSANANAQRATNDRYVVSKRDFRFSEYEKISSQRHLEEIIKVYISYSDDFDASSIDLAPYFRFDDRPSDINYMPKVMLESLPVVLPRQTINGLVGSERVYLNYGELGTRDAKESEDELRKHRIGFETRYLWVEINQSSMNFSVEYSFIYDLVDKKISNLSVGRWRY